MDNASLPTSEVTEHTEAGEIQTATDERQPTVVDSPTAPDHAQLASADVLIRTVLSDDPPTEADLDRIIAALDVDSLFEIPESAVRAAQRYSTEITPRLIDLLRKAAAIMRNDDDEMPGTGHLLAFLLLTEFRATEALPALVEAISLPDDLAYEMLGDSITEDLTRVLAALAVDAPQTIDDLIADRAVDEYVRGAAAGVYLYWVRDGRLTRDEAVARLHEHLQRACELRDEKIVHVLVNELCRFSPVEAMQTIEHAYQLNIVDDIYIGLDEVQDSVTVGEAFLQRELQGCRPTGFEDAYQELKIWQRCANLAPPESGHDYKSMPWGDDEDDLGDWDDDQNHLKAWGDDDADSEPIHAPTTIVNAGPRVGRNDPCPCNSGKKYKKCCGGR